MHQASWLVKDISNERESELLEDFLRSTIVGVMPGVDFRTAAIFPRRIRARRTLLPLQAIAPTALHEMGPHFETRPAGRIHPGPKPAAPDELAIAVIEQRPILNATRPLPLDLGAELLSVYRAQVGLARESDRVAGRVVKKTQNRESGKLKFTPLQNEPRAVVQPGHNSKKSLHIALFVGLGLWEVGKDNGKMQ